MRGKGEGEEKRKGGGRRQGEEMGGKEKRRREGGTGKKGEDEQRGKGRVIDSKTPVYSRMPLTCVCLGVRGHGQVSLNKALHIPGLPRGTVEL